MTANLRGWYGAVAWMPLPNATCSPAVIGCSSVWWSGRQAGITLISRDPCHRRPAVGHPGEIWRTGVTIEIQRVSDDRSFPGLSADAAAFESGSDLLGVEEGTVNVYRVETNQPQVEGAASHE